LRICADFPPSIPSEAELSHPLGDLVASNRWPLPVARLLATPLPCTALRRPGEPNDAVEQVIEPILCFEYSAAPTTGCGLDPLVR
jgi:hypothetical protein